MPVQIPLDPKHLEGVASLVEALEILGVEVTEAVQGRPQAPAEIAGVQPHVKGSLGGQTVYGVFITVQEITKESVKSFLSAVEKAAQPQKAKCMAGILGKPAKGFSGIEQTVQMEKLIASGWEVVDL